MDNIDFNRKTVEIIKLLRKSRNVKQYAISCALNIDQSSYSRIENGDTIISLHQFKVILEELDISMWQFILIIESDLKEYYENPSLIFENLHVLENELNLGKNKTNLSEYELGLILSKLNEKSETKI